MFFICFGNIFCQTFIRKYFLIGFTTFSSSGLKEPRSRINIYLPQLNITGSVTTRRATITTTAMRTTTIAIREHASII